MAKVGLWLRGAKGKLAGASLGKGSDGSTIIREIVTPRNPKTEKQLYQRAIMASIMLGYSQMKEIADHAFQGYAVGAECQRRFISLNSRRLRSQLAADLTINNLNPEQRQGRFVNPRSTTMVPWSFQISEGTYNQNLFLASADAEGDTVFSLPAIQEGEKVGDYAQRLSLIAGDIYTIIVLAPNLLDARYETPSDMNGNYGRVFATSFGFCRLIVKNAVEDEVFTKLGQLFEVEVSGNVRTDMTQVNAADPINIETLGIVRDTMGQNINIGAIGIIRSRRDQDLRSTTILSLNQISSSSDFMDGTGLTSLDLLEAWQGADAVGSSQLILEGGNRTRGNSVSINGETYTPKLGHCDFQDSRYFGNYVLLLTDSNGVDHMPVCYTPNGDGETGKDVVSYPYSQSRPESAEAFLNSIQAGSEPISDIQGDVNGAPGNQNAWDMDDANPMVGISLLAVTTAYAWGTEDAQTTQKATIDTAFYNAVNAMI